MLYQGQSDWGVTPSQTLMYYDALRRTMGGQEETDRFTRLYLVPGMSHCAGGPTPNTSDMLLQMVRWVEDGQAPDSILASDRGPAGQGTLQRPVFRYPLVARYVGPNPTQDPTGPDTPEHFVASSPAKAHADSVDWVGSFLMSESTDTGASPQLGASSNASSSRSQASADTAAQEHLIGAWRLVWLEEPGADGKLHRPDCTGMFVFTREGRAAVQVMYRGQQPATAAGPVQYAQAGYEASFGRYEVDEAARTFTYHVEGALVRGLVGKDLVRSFELSGRQLIVRSSNPSEQWQVAWEHY